MMTSDCCASCERCMPLQTSLAHGWAQAAEAAHPATHGRARSLSLMSRSNSIYDLLLFLVNIHMWQPGA